MQDPRLSRRWQGMLVHVAIVFSLLLMSVVSVAADEAVLQFLTQEPLNLKADQSSYDVGLVNGRAEPLTGVEFELVNVVGPDGKPLGGDGLSVEWQPDSLIGYSVASFSLTFTKPIAELADGTYRGFLVAKAEGVPPATRPFAWQIGAAAEPVAAAASLAWLDEEKLVLLGSSAQTVGVPLANSEKGKATDITFQVVALHDQVGKSLPDGTIQVGQEPDTLEGQSVATFELTFSTRDGLNEGIYEGFLVAKASTVKPIHRPFRWEISRDTLQGFVPEAESLTFETTTGFLSPLIRLVGAISGRRGSEPSGQTVTAQALPNLRLYGKDAAEVAAMTKEHPVLVTLRTDNNQEALLELTGPKASTAGVEAGLSLKNASVPGKYTGSLLLDPSDPDTSKKLGLTVLIRDHWLWALLAVLAGLSVSWAIARWRTVVRPGLEIERLALETQTLIQKENPQVANGTGFTLVEAAQTTVQEISKEIDEGELEEAKKRQEALLALLNDYRTFMAKARGLYDSHEKLGKEFPEAKDTNAYKETKKFFGQGVLKVEHANHLQSLTKKVDGWTALNLALLATYPRWSLAMEIYKKVPSPMADTDHEVLRKRAKARLDGVKQDLWKATTAEDLEKWHVERFTEWALDTVRWLAVIELVGAKTLSAHWTAIDDISNAIRTKASELWRALTGVEAPLTVQLTGRRPDPERQSKRNSRMLNWGDKLAFAFVFLVAAVTAMWLLYPSKPFGTGWDYVAAFLWGSGVDQASKGLSSLLTKLGIGQS